MHVPSPIDPEALLAETGMVRRLAQALVRRADLAHDVAQDVLLVALRQPQPPQNLRGWLATVTRRLAGKALRAQRLRTQREGEAAPPTADDTERRTTDRLQLHRRLTDAVLALAEPYRTTVTLHFFDELPPRAIAQQLGTSSEVIRKRLQRGIHLLRLRLDGEFGDRVHWARALAAAGLLDAGSPWIRLTVLAMHKLALAAAVTLAVGTWWWWPNAELRPLATASVAGSVAATPVGAHEDDATLRTPAAQELVTQGAGVLANCSLQVVDEYRVPIVDAVVHCWSEGAAIANQRTTDREGHCEFGPRDGPGGCLVIAEGRPPYAEPMAEQRGTHRIVLPAGATISGVLLVDGNPGAGWALTLDSCALAEFVPEALRRRHARGSCRVRCDRGGAFAFVGLAIDWHGSLELPQSLWLLSGGDDDSFTQFAVVAGQRQLDVRATQLPTLRGRALWNDTQEPVPFPTANGYAEFVDGSHSPSIGVTGDADGSFAIGFHPSHRGKGRQWLDPKQRQALREVRLMVDDAQGVAEQTLVLDATALAATGERLVYLTRPAITHFRCLDEAGRPIAGARVKARNVSEATDADGRGTFLGARVDVQLVGSAHHRIGPLEPGSDAVGTAEDPLRFVLPNQNLVRIHVADRSAAGQKLVVRSKIAMFAGQRQLSPLDEQLHGKVGQWSASGTTQADGKTAWQEFRLEVATDAAGLCQLHSLEPGVACEVVLPDYFGRDLASQQFIAPPFGEQLEVAVPVLVPTGRLTGRVLDEAGLPIAGVDITLKVVGSKSYRHPRTDAQGRFEVHDPGSLENSRITLRAKGYAEQTQDLPTTGGDRLYTLQRGREVEIHVVDEHGEPLDQTPIWPGGNDDSHREWLRTGVWRWRDLPPGDVTLYCLVGGDRFPIVHDTAQPIATLQVPRPASLRLAAPNGWPVLADARHALVAVLRCVDAEREVVRIWRPETAKPQNLLPGRWHIELVESSRSEGAPEVELSLGLAAEITLRTGDDATAQLR